MHKLEGWFPDFVPLVTLWPEYSGPSNVWIYDTTETEIFNGHGYRVYPVDVALGNDVEPEQWCSTYGEALVEHCMCTGHTSVSVLHESQISFPKIPYLYRYGLNPIDKSVANLEAVRLFSLARDKYEKES